jgi:mycothiol synthase
LPMETTSQTSSESLPYRQLWMAWPDHLLHTPPAIPLPDGYMLRTYRPGDERRFFDLMALAGWPDWDDARLRPWAARLLPDGWFMAVHRASDTIVATAMALRDCGEFGVEGGELGWVAANPVQLGKRLGTSVSAAVTTRLLAARYRHIHLYTEVWRLAAVKTYLKLGYVPLLYAPEMPERWRTICDQVAWPFTPEAWKAQAPHR